MKKLFAETIEQMLDDDMEDHPGLGNLVLQRKKSPEPIQVGRKIIPTKCMTKDQYDETKQSDF